MVAPIRPLPRRVHVVRPRARDIDLRGQGHHARSDHRRGGRGRTGGVVGDARASGSPTTATRSPSSRRGLEIAQTLVALVNAILVVGLWWVLRRWINRRVATIAAIIIATEPFLVVHGARLDHRLVRHALRCDRHLRRRGGAGHPARRARPPPPARAGGRRRRRSRGCDREQALVPLGRPVPRAAARARGMAASTTRTARARRGAARHHRERARVPRRAVAGAVPRPRGPDHRDARLGPPGRALPDPSSSSARPPRARVRSSTRWCWRSARRRGSSCSRSRPPLAVWFRRTRPYAVLMLLYAAVPFVVITLASLKYDRYSLPLWPAAAVLAALVVEVGILSLLQRAAGVAPVGHGRAGRGPRGDRSGGTPRGARRRRVREPAAGRGRGRARGDHHRRSVEQSRRRAHPGARRRPVRRAADLRHRLPWRAAIPVRSGGRRRVDAARRRLHRGRRVARSPAARPPRNPSSRGGNWWRTCGAGASTSPTSSWCGDRLAGGPSTRGPEPTAGHRHSRRYRARTTRRASPRGRWWPRAGRWGSSSRAAPRPPRPIPPGCPSDARRRREDRDQRRDRRDHQVHPDGCVDTEDRGTRSRIARRGTRASPCR